MIRTRRWLYGVLGVTMLATAFPIAAQAQSAEPPVVRDSAADSVDGLQSAKDRVSAEINKRLVTLERLTDRVNTAERLTSDHMAALLADFVAAERVLNDGLDAVNAATSPEELREIVRPIFEDTLVFALLVPKTHAVIASDFIAAITDRHGEVAAKLQADLDQLSASGVDVAEPQANLDEATSIVADVAAVAGPVADSVIGLQPGDEIKTPLSEAREALRGTRGQLHQARRLTQQVAAFIRGESAPPVREG